MLKVLILIFILIILLVLITNKLYKKTNHYKNEIEQLQKYIKGVPQDLEIINLGSSYGKHAFDYSHISLNGFNFALQPQSLSYDFRILKQYTPNLKENCRILITFPALVFGFLDYSDDKANTKYYDFLDKKEIIGYSKLKYLIRVIFPVFSHKFNILRIFKDVKKQPQNCKKNLLTEKEVKKEAILRVNGWKKQFKLKNTIHYEKYPELEKMFVETTKLLAEMIDYCIENNFKPMIIVPPTSGILNEMLSKEFIKKVLYENIEKANKKKIPILDYLYDESFQDYKLYINSDMLNVNGRKLFTKRVFKDIENLENMMD